MLLQCANNDYNDTINVVFRIVNCAIVGVVVHVVVNDIVSAIERWHTDWTDFGMQDDFADVAIRGLGRLGVPFRTRVARGFCCTNMFAGCWSLVSARGAECTTTTVQLSCAKGCASALEMLWVRSVMKYPPCTLTLNL